MLEKPEPNTPWSTFQMLKNPSVFSRGIFQVLKKVVQGQQHLISQGLIALRWWQKTLSKMHFDEAKSIQLHLMLFCLILMHFALCFLPSSLCNALGWWQKPLSKMHLDVAKKHSASPHTFLPHPYAICFVLFVIILMYSLDIKCCWPWTTFWILEISLQKNSLGFF